jgi:hypothetical protein
MNSFKADIIAKSHFVTVGGYTHWRRRWDRGAGDRTINVKRHTLRHTNRMVRKKVKR